MKSVLSSILSIICIIILVFGPISQVDSNSSISNNELTNNIELMENSIAPDNIGKNQNTIDILMMYHNDHDLVDLNPEIIKENYHGLKMATINLDSADSEELTHLINFVQERDNIDLFPLSLLEDEIEDGIEIIDPQIGSNQINFYQYQIIHDLLGITRMHELGYTGQNLNYTQIDDGIDPRHPAFGNRVIKELDFSSEETETCGNHGTAVAGLAVAQTSPDFKWVKGGAPSSDIISIGLGCGEFGYAGDFLKAYNFVIENNQSISILNTSYGGNGLIIDIILKKVTQSGILIVGSTGNDGPDKGTTGNAGPGNSIHGLAVGASNFSGYITSFSSRGYAHNLQLKPDIIAPGLGLNTTNKGGGITTASGTSLSAPLVSGAMLSLLQGIRDHGWQSNPGLLKAAVMKSATRIVPITKENQIAYGHGILNISGAYDLIVNSKKISNIPTLVELSPAIGPHPAISTIPAGVNRSEVNIELTQISSHPKLVTYQFTGELQNRLFPSDPTSDYSQSIKFQVDTTGLQPGDSMKGKIIATVGNDTSSSNITITIGQEFRGMVGIDLHHTGWDLFSANELGGGNIGLMAELAMKLGYGVTEISTQLNNSVLELLDVLWMPDPLNIYDNRTSDLFGVLEYPLVRSEMDAIHQFVDQGGTLFIDFIGTIQSSDGSLNYINQTTVNRLLQPYSIQVFNDPRDAPISIEPVYPTIESSLTRNIDRITHYGNFLETGNEATTHLIDTKGRGMLATSTTENGRVIVSTTNFWLDNYGVAGNYTFNGLNDNSTDDPQLSHNLWDWINSTERLHLLSVEEESELQVLELQSSTQPDLGLVNQTSSNFDITIETTGTSIYQIEIRNNSGLSDYSLNISTSTEYFIYHFQDDTQLPEFNRNWFVFEQAKDNSFNLTTSIEIKDNSASIDDLRYGIYISDVFIPFTYSRLEHGNIIFSVTSELLDKVNSQLVNSSTIITLVVMDNVLNSASYQIDITKFLEQTNFEHIEKSLVNTFLGISAFIIGVNIFNLIWNRRKEYNLVNLD